MFRFLALLILCLPAYSFQTVSSDAANGSLPWALFRIEQQGFQVSPERRVLLMEEPEGSVTFNYFYDGEVGDGLRLTGLLVSPSGIETPLSQDFALGRITLTRDQITEEGTWQLTNLQILDGEALVAESTPEVVTVDAVAELLVARATVEEMTAEELAALGYVFNPDDYRSVKFNLSLVMGSTEVPVEIPMLLPAKPSKTLRWEMPIADPFQEGRIYVVEPRFNGTPDLGFEAETGAASISSESYVLSLVVIPGKIHHLKSLFRAAVLVVNAAPDGIDVRVENLTAKIAFPPPTKYGHPLGLSDTDNGGLERPMLYLGSDEELGTADDRPFIDPSEEAMAEYYLRGNLPGMYDVNFDIRGEAQIGGDDPFLVQAETQARVYVRSPDYTVTFEHPDTVASGEPYDLTMHINNVGEIPLNNFSIEIDPFRLVGVTMEAATNPVQAAGNIPAGGEASLTWRLRADTTGQVVASYYRVEEGVSSNLQLSVGIAPSGERLTNHVLLFPPEFEAAFENPLKMQVRRFAKKVHDLSHMAEEELPPGLLPISARDARRLNERFGFAAVSLGLGGSLDQAHFDLLRNIISGMDGNPALDRFRREMTRISEPNMTMAFEPLLQQWLAARDGRDLLTWMLQESRSLQNTALVLIEGDTNLSVTVTDPLGRQSDDGGVLDIPFSAVFRVGEGRRLVWLNNLVGSPQITVNGAAGASLRVQAVFNENAQTEPTYFDSGSWSPASDPTLALLPEQGRWQILEGGAGRLVDGERLAPRAFELLGVKQMSPLDGSVVDIYGRHIAFQFSQPLDLSAIADLGAHIHVGGEPVVTGRLQNNPRFLVVKARTPHGPYEPISYRLEGLTARDGTVLAPVTGTLQGDPFFRGVSLVGRVADQSGSDLTQAKVYLMQNMGSSDRAEVASGFLGSNVIMAETNLDENGRYAFDFVPVLFDGVQVPSEENNPYAYDRDYYARLADYLEQQRQIQIVVELVDGRREIRYYQPQAPGQQIVAEIAFLDKGTVYGQLLDENGAPIANVPVYAYNQEKLQGYAQLTTTDARGMYRFDGLEVGQIAIKTAKPGGSMAWRGAFLTRQNSPLRVDIGFDMLYGGVQGRVVAIEDGVARPIANAVVGWYAVATQPFTYLFGPEQEWGMSYNVLTRTDDQGYYRLEEAPGGTGRLWAIAPGGVVNRVVTIAPDTMIDVDLQIAPQEVPYGSISGRVVDAQNFPLAGMTVAGGGRTTLSGADGSFTLSRIPFTQRNISLNAVKHQTQWPYEELLRGKATLSLGPETPDVTDVLIVAITSPKISGRYLNASGEPIPFAPIYNPPDDGLKRGRPFAYTDHTGAFEGKLFDTSNFPRQYWDPHTGLQTGNNHFTGLRSPKLAHTEVTIGMAGYENLVVQEEPQSQLRVNLVDGSGQPVIGSVEVMGYMPSFETESMGMPIWNRMYLLVTDENGSVLFDQLNVRETQIQGKHPLLGETEIYALVPQVLAEGAEIPTITLAFSSQNEPTNLFGRVFDSDGVSPAPEGTLVVAKVGGLTAKTRTNPEGWYWFDTLVSTAEDQVVDLTAYHPVSTHWSGDRILLDREMRFRHDLVLAQRGSLEVHLVDSNGTAVDTGNVVVSYRDVAYQEAQIVSELGELDYVPLTFSQQVLPGGGPLVFENIPVGEVTLKGLHGNGLTAMKSLLLPRDGRRLVVYLHLETPGSVSGIFRDQLDETVPEGEVQLQRFNRALSSRLTADAASGNPGYFHFDALPMQRYTLFGVDPDNGLSGTTEVEPTPFRPDPQVVLRVDPVGHINGTVAFEGQVVPNARIELLSGWEGTPEIRLITGADQHGTFELRNLPLGPYRLIVSADATSERAQEFVVIEESGETITPVVQFQPMHNVSLQVLYADGSPAAHIGVSMAFAGSMFFKGANGFTDENGRVLLQNLPPNDYTIQSRDSRLRDAIYEGFAISRDDPTQIEHTVQFPGWGVVRGQVVDERGVPIDYSVRIRVQDRIRFGSNLWSYLDTDANGNFTMWHAPLNRTLSVLALSDRFVESDVQHLLLSEHGEEVDLVLTMRQMTRASGQVVFSDGNPVPYAKVWVEEPIEIITQADENGRYLIEPISAGGMTLFAKDPFSPRTGQVYRLSETYEDGAVQPHTEVNVTLAGVGAMSGNVFLSDGGSVNYGHLMLEHLASGATRQAALFADGSWLQTNMPIGRYRVQAYDSERTVWSEQTIELDLAEDGGSVAGDITFQPSYQVRGRVLATGRINGVRDALVELWRYQNGTRWQRVYRDTSRDEGYYFMEHVYPGSYRVVIKDETLSNTFTGELTVGDGDITDADFELQPVRDLLGVVTNADNEPLYPGSVQIMSASGELLNSTSLNQRGEFSFGGLSLSEVRVVVTTLRGWYTFDRVVSLQPGANAVAFTGPQTVRVRGRVIAQSESRVGVTAGMTYRGRSRGQSGANDGSFEISHVPAGEVLEMYVIGGGMRRFSVGPFSEDTDLGDIHVDTTAPELADFPDGIRVTQMPAVVHIPVSEADQESYFAPAQTQVWLNGQSLTAFLVNDPDAVVLQVPAFPDQAVRGYNVLKVAVENQAGLRAVKNYPFYIDTPGATLALNVNDTNWRDVPGLAALLEDGRTDTTDADGTAYFYNLTLPTARVWARDGDLGGFLAVPVSQTAATTFAALRLMPAGGYFGQVTDGDGNPLADVTVWADDQPAVTDLNGRYFMRVVPTHQDTDLIVDDSRGFGFLQAGRLSVPGTFADGYDIQLEPVGTVIGTVTQSDGVTPVGGAAVALAYETVPERFNQVVTAAADGTYRIERVFAEPLRLTARHPSTDQIGLVTFPSMQPGQTATLDISLEPVGALVGRLLLPNGNPAAGLTIQVQGRRDAVYASAETGPDGAFQITEVPYGEFALEAESQPDLAFLDRDFSLSTTNRDFADLTMSVDQTPSLTVFNPTVFDPVLRPLVRFEASDDRRLASLTVTADAFPELAETQTISGMAVNNAFRVPLPESLDYGPLPITVTVVDHFGQTTEWRGDLNVADDVTPPGMTLVSPTETPSLEEGSTFDVVVDTVDAHSVTVSYQGVTVGTGYRGAFGSDRFTAQVRVPAVDASGTIALDVIARDQRGNQTRLSVPVHVVNRDIGGLPTLVVTSHSDGQVMPLNLDRDLVLDLKLRAEDPDGLTLVTIQVDGQEVHRANLTATAYELTHPLVLPPVTTRREQVVVRVDLDDLGFNRSSQTITLQNIDGEVFDAVQPLQAGRFNSSLSGRSLILAGGVHIIDGRHQPQDLVLVNGAEVVLSPSGDSLMGEAAVTDLAVSRHLVIDHGSAVRADRVGFKGFSLYPDAVPYPSHGGMTVDDETALSTYGSLVEPTLVGSYNGGGALRLRAPNFWLHGEVSARGNWSGSRYVGSGGSIWLQSDNLQGFGRVVANAFTAPGDEIVSAPGGGGGRIAVYGNSRNLTLEALGRRGGGHGTIFLKIPDPSYSDGTHDLLRVAGADMNETAVATPIPWFSGIVGQDIEYLPTQQGPDGYRDKLILPSPVGFERYRGLYVWRDGEPENRKRIDTNAGTEIVSEVNEAFPVFQAGDRLHIGYPLDAIEVVDGGRLMSEAALLRSPVFFDGGFLKAVTGATQVLSDHVIRAGGGLEGAFTGPAVNVPGGAAFHIDGSFQTPQMDVSDDATLYLNGVLSSDRLVVAQTGLIENLPWATDPRLEFQVTEGEIYGAVRVAPVYEYDADRYWTHAGLRAGVAGRSPFTSGSLYEPGTFAGARGGVLHMRFDDLLLDGTLDVGYGRVGGAAWLQGTRLRGTGLVRADGYQHTGYAYGGGRIALWVDDIDGFSGNLEARGFDPDRVSDGSAGAGTIFLKTAVWPQGRLIADNGGRSAAADSTVLPAFGTRTAGVGTTSTVLAGDFPAHREFVGMVLTVDGYDPQVIVDQTTESVTLAAPIEGLVQGVAVSAFHRLNEVVLRDGASVFSADSIHVSGDVLLEGGDLNASVVRVGAGETRVFADGAGALTQDDGSRMYELDNFQLTVHFPMDVSRISLRNGASLTYYEPVRVETLEVSQGSLYSGVAGRGFGFIADNVSLSEGSVWSAAPNRDGVAPARVNIDVIGTLALDATSRIETAGENGGAPLSANNSDVNHAGYSSATFVNSQGLSDNPVHGSFYQPEHQSYAGGGAVHIRAATLQLDGTVSTAASGTNGGGSIWLEAQDFLGAGRLDTGNNPGRIALFHGGDAGFLDRYTITAHTTETVNQTFGAGTVFVKGADQAYGELIVDQDALNRHDPEDLFRRYRMTGLVGPSQLTVSTGDRNPDPQVIDDVTWTDLPLGMAGLWVRFQVADVAYEARVRDNDADQIMLHPPTSGTLPATIPAGTELRFVLRLDRLHLRNGGALFFAGDVELGELVLDPSEHVASLWARDVKGLPNPMTLSGRRLRLILDEPGLQDQVFNLQDSQLWLDKPIALDSLNLVNSQVLHSPPDAGLPDHFYEPWLHVTARAVSMDAQSRFSGTGLGTYYGADGTSRWHHGGAFNDSHNGPTGSIFYPGHFGFGEFFVGGRIFLNAAELNGGTFDVTSRGGAAGSIQLDVGVVRGDITLNAGPWEGISASGGGRISVVYDTLENATFHADTRALRNAGTFFLKARSADYGRLIIDNGDLGLAGQRETILPSFSPVSLDANFTLADDGARSTLFVPGLTLPDSFRGYQLAVNGDVATLYPIEATVNRDGGVALTLSGVLAGLQAGDVVEPVVRLAAVDLCADCRIGPASLKIVTDNEFPAGHVFADGEGSFVDPPNVADGHLILDGYTMQIERPANYAAVTLRNGASLHLNGAENQITTVELDGASLVVAEDEQDTPTLTADVVRLRGNATLSVLYLSTNTLTVEAGATVQGRIFQGEPLRWGTGNVSLSVNQTVSFGGLEHLPRQSTLFGDFRRPWRVTTGMSRLRVVADQVEVDGALFPGTNPQLGQSAPGGALWLTVGRLQGAGRIHANAPVFLEQGVPAGGGGRVAVHYADLGAWEGIVEARGAAYAGTANQNENLAQTGAGTVFLKSDQQTYGDLHLLGNNRRGLAAMTRVPSVGTITLGDRVGVDGNRLEDPDADFPIDLQGLHLVIDEAGTPQVFEIIENTKTSITVMGTLPSLGSGAVLRGQLQLDGIRVTDMARFYTPDHLVIHGGILASPGNRPGDIWSRRLTLPQSNWLLEGGSAGLRVDEGTNLTDIEVRDGTLELNGRWSLNSLTVHNGGRLVHSPVMPLHRENPPQNHYGLQLALQTLTVASGGHIDLDGLGLEDEPFIASTGFGHAGNYSGSNAYGSAFEPDLPGGASGGGVLKVTAATVQLDGAVTARGPAGGSLWFDVGVIRGDGLISADAEVSERGSAGRVALHYDDNQLTSPPTAKSQPRAASNELPGAGTVFLRRRDQRDGELFVLNDPVEGAAVQVTPLAAVGSHTLAATPENPQILNLSGVYWRPGLAGMDIVDLQTNETYRIIEHSERSLTLDRPISPVPTAGWSFRGRAPISRVFQGNARLQADSGEMAAPVQDGFERTPPTLDQFVLDTPYSGAVVSGGSFAVDLAASDAGGVASATVSFNGSTETGTGGGPWRFAFTAPVVTQAAVYPVEADVRDVFGNRRTARLDLQVLAPDTVAPVVALLEPLADTALDAAETFTVRVQAGDNYGLDRLVYTWGEEIRTVALANTPIDHVDEQTFTTPVVVGNQTQTLMVTAYDGSALTSVATLELVVRDTTAPEPVTALTALPAVRETEVRWHGSLDTAGDLAGYEVVLDGGAPIAVDPTTTLMMLNELQAETTYQVAVVAVDQSGNRSEPVITTFTTLSDSGVTRVETPDAWWSFNRDSVDQTVATFDGNSAYVAFPNSLNLGRKAEGLTIALWVKGHSLEGIQSVLTLRHSENNEALAQLEFSNANLYIYGDRGPSFSRASTYASLQKDVWFRIVTTLDPVQKRIEIYQDGEHVRGSFFQGDGPLPDSPHAYVHLGANNQRTFFDGNLRDLQIWRGVWRPEDVSLDYRRPGQSTDPSQLSALGFTMNPNDLVAAWPLDGRVAGQVWDTSFNQNHGLPVNVSWELAQEHLFARTDAVAGLPGSVGPRRITDNGVFGSALLFDGNQKPSDWQAPTLGGSSFASSILVRLDQLPSSLGRAMTLFEAGGAVLSVNALDQIVWQAHDGATMTATASLGVDRWHHVVVRREGETTHQLLIDGAVVAETALAGGTAPAGAWSLGHRTDGSETLVGAVDEWIVWSRQPQASALATLAREPLSSLQAGLALAMVDDVHWFAGANTLDLSWSLLPNQPEVAAWLVTVDGSAPIRLGPLAGQTQITGLSPETSYQITVQAETAGGDISVGVSRRVVTASAAAATDTGPAPQVYVPFDQDGPTVTSPAFVDDTTKIDLPVPTNLLEGSLGLTFVAWVKMPGDNSRRNLFYLGDGSREEPIQVYTGSGRVTAAARPRINVGASNLTTSSSINDNQWHRLVMVVDYAGNKMATYVDGELSASRNAMSGNLGYYPSGSYAHMVIGGHPRFTSYAFVGGLADVQLWRAVWRPEDVAYDFANPLRAAGRTAPDSPLSPSRDLLFQTLFDQAQGNKVWDHSGNGLHGTAAQLTWSETLPLSAFRDVFSGRNLQAEGLAAVRGYAGQAAEFSRLGAGAWLDAEGLPTQNGSTVSLWFQAPALGEDGTIAARSDRNGGLEIGFDRELRPFLAARADRRFISARAMTAGRWHHLAVAVDASGDSILYLDGQPTAFAANTVIPTAEPWRLGHRWRRSGGMRGLVDEFAWWAQRLPSDRLLQTGTQPAGLSLTDHFEVPVNPAEVVNLAVAPTSDRLVFSWQAPVHSLTTLTGYRIYRDGAATGIFVAAPQTGYVWDGLAPDQSHTLRVTTVDQWGNESAGQSLRAWTAPATAAAIAPATPNAWYDFELPSLDRRLPSFADRGRRVTVSDNLDGFMAGADGVTLAVWVRADSKTSWTTQELIKLNRGSNPLVTLQLSGNHLRLQARPVSTTSSMTLTGSTPLLDGRWHRVVGVVDLAAQQVRLYVDGVLEGERATSWPQTSWPDPSEIDLVELGDDSVNFVNGLMWNAQAWRAVFDREAVQRDYQYVFQTAADQEGVTNLSRDDLEAQWLLNDGTNGSISDSSTHARHGIATDLVWLDATNPVPAIGDLVARRPLQLLDALPSDSGILGAGLTVDGSGAVLSAEDAADVNGSFGISFWLKPNGLPSSRFADAALVMPADGDWSLILAQNDRLALALDGHVFESSGSPFADGVWTHLTVTGTPGGNLEVYQDGIRVLSQALPAAGDLGAGLLIAGGINGIKPASLDLDQVGLWSTALTAGQAVWLQQHPAGVPLAKRADPAKGADPAPATPRRESTAVPVVAGDSDTEIVRGQTLVRDVYQTEKTLVLDNTVLELGGSLIARSIELRNGARLTHPPLEDGSPGVLLIAAAERIEIDFHSSIDVDGRGWAQRGERFNPAHAEAASEPTTGTVYGSLLEPSLPGGGKQGGGVVMLIAPEIVIDGRVTARGIGYSSGGSVLIQTAELSGSGLIDVRGGSDASGRGGAGRIAVHSDRAYRFGGRMETGAVDAALILVADSRAENRRLLTAFPEAPQRRSPARVVLPPALQLRGDELKNGRFVGRRLLVEVVHSQDLHAYLGFAAQTPFGLVWIREVTEQQPGSWLLLLDGSRMEERIGDLRFFLELNNADDLLVEEGMVPLKMP